jgi:hypothetical protein
MFFLPSQAEGIDDGRSPYVTATAVTTRTAMTHEDKEKNEKTSQVHCILILLVLTVSYFFHEINRT